MLKIGITFDPPNSPIEMFNNGIKQNAFYFLELLINCGYDAQLIIAPGKEEKVQNLYGFDSGRFKWEKFENILSAKFDIVIQFVFQIPTDIIKALKVKGSKVIAYFCGNEYVVIVERTLFGIKGNHNLQYSKERLFDQIWSIPQHEHTNFEYWKTLHRTEVVKVDPIWSPISIEQLEINEIQKGKSDFSYKNRGKEKKLAIFEPNINIIKWFLPSLLVCENAYRKQKDLIQFVYLTNIQEKKEPFSLEMVNDLVQSLDLMSDKKISIEARYNTLFFMSNYADVVVSHQWENPLNYLYLDLAWYGWPIIHNAHLCADIGYYYEDFNYSQAAEVLVDVLKNHDKNATKYKQKNKRAIERFLPSNKNMQNKYKLLIENLIKNK